MEGCSEPRNLDDFAAAAAEFREPTCEIWQNFQWKTVVPTKEDISGH